MKVLITGFEPFGSEIVNPSYEAIKLLPDYIGDLEIIKAELPVSFEASGPALIKAITLRQPDAVVCVGQASGYAGVALERVAINLRDASIPDNCGLQPIDQPVVSDGPPAYFSTLPVKKIVNTLQNQGIPAFVSNSAGTYVCNNLMYILLHLIHQERPSMQGGFIHVPYVMEQAANKSPIPPSMELSLITKALELAMKALV